MKKAILYLFLAAALLLAWFGFDVYRKVFVPYQGYPAKTIVRIKPGYSVAAISFLLQRQGVIASAAYFKRYYSLFFRGKTLKAGEYLFDGPLTMRQVIKKLDLGKAILYKLTFTEGLMIEDMAMIFQEAGLFSAGEFMHAARNTDPIGDLDADADDLEGYLFPDTYLVRKDISASEMAALMVKHFREIFSNTLIWRARDIGLTVRQAVIMASLIEKETAARDERFLISSVFHNRLRHRMLLDCDSTIIYALKKAGLYRGKLGWDDLKFPSPYNTRLYRGLPPGPIANPGYASLEAALYPENSDYLFFVAKDAGS
ncbi:MAG: endolytic transglycosylase MltG, partial [Candidatus Aminicenantes bacterium]|nr:endolytic transglycosylase MltG [Candidatus Aminicenantes bacterium]